MVRAFHRRALVTYQSRLAPDISLYVASPLWPRKIISVFCEEGIAFGCVHAVIVDVRKAKATEKMLGGKQQVVAQNPCSVL
jgi:diphthamide synthase (EF-2-diphthine--ammonia ligase)